MKAWPRHPAWRPTLAMVMLLGLGLLALGLNRTGWAERGVIVATAELNVPGAPPWNLSLAVPSGGVRYLLESTVTGSTPLRAMSAAPELRVEQADGERLTGVLEPTEAGATVARGETVEILNHWWCEASRPGEYRFELVTLNASAELQPRRWRLRLAEGVPPSGATGPGPLTLLGFVLAAGAFLLLVVAPRPDRA